MFHRTVAFCIFMGVATAAPVTLTRHQDQIDVAVDGKPFTTYFFSAEVAKAYLMPLRTASGLVLTRDFPVGNDIPEGTPRNSSFEPHQRPLYFGHGNIDGLDFWGEQAFKRYYSNTADKVWGHAVPKSVEVKDATIRAGFELQDSHGRAIAQETQALTFGGEGKLRIIDCAFTIEATTGDVVLGDTKEGTFAIRVGRELSAPLGHMLNSKGAEGEGAIWGKPADWVDFSGTVSGQAVGIAVLDSPKSFRHPTTWHARGYGLLAANPFGLREFTKDENKDGSWTIPKGKALNFQYRVLIHEGDFTAERLAEEYKRYSAYAPSNTKTQ